eukprot:scaffold204543_cov47-Prasinocladus_malaysianus.AAC.1
MGVGATNCPGYVVRRKHLSASSCQGQRDHCTRLNGIFATLRTISPAFQMLASINRGNIKAYPEL